MMMKLSHSHNQEQSARDLFHRFCRRILETKLTTKQLAEFDEYCSHPPKDGARQITAYRTTQRNIVPSRMINLWREIARNRKERERCKSIIIYKLI